MTGLERLKELPNDIYNLFDPERDHKIDEKNLEIFFKDLRNILVARLGKQSKTSERPVRFSSLGRPDRQVWMDANPDPNIPPEPLLPKTYVKFLYGDVIEQLFLFLAREAGHTVTDQQRQVEVNGVTGSIDCLIDGVLVDVKSASPFGYKKFEDGTIIQDDPFGYVYQLSGYASVVTPGEPAAWLAVDKTMGDVCVTPLPHTVIKHHDPTDRINHLKQVVSSDTPPPICYSPVPDGKSGNMQLAKECSYCVHKRRCFPSVRTFLYSTGPRYLTEVVREPNVPELVD